MRKIIIVQLILYTLLLTDLSNAQQYYPFQTETAKWSVYSRMSPWPPPPIISTFQYFINGDTLIDSKIYSAIYRGEAYLSANIDTVNSIYLGGLREDSDKYIYYKPGEIYQEISHQCYIENSTLDEFVLYRFDINEGDTFYLNQFIPYPYIVVSIDSVLIGSSYRKIYNLQGGGNDFGIDEWIEGVGSMWSLFGPHCVNFEGVDYLMCYEDPSTFYYGSFNNSDRCTDFIVGNIEKEKSIIKIYPNPAKNELYISVNNPELFEIKIFNQLGQMVLFEDEIRDRIDISKLDQGIYIVEILLNELNIREKLIIKE